MRLLTLFTAAVTIAAMAGCDSARIYERNEDLANKIWHQDSTVTFNFTIKNTRKKYNLYYNLRNTASYPFSNIYVTYRLADTLGNVIKEELINRSLFDEKTGRPFGSGLGDVFDHQFVVLKDYEFNRVGGYRFSLEQYMRRDSLPEILSVGFRLEESLKE